MAMPTGLIPEAEARNSVSPATQQNKTSRLPDRIAAVDATARRIGNTPQSLTVRIRVNPDSNPFGFNPTDCDFDLSKTAQTLTLATGGINPRTIIIQKSQDTAQKPEDRFEAIVTGSRDTATFKARLEGTPIDGEVPTVDRNITESLKPMEGDQGPAAYSMPCPVLHPVGGRHPIKSCHGTPTEAVDNDALTEHETKGGTVTMPADGGTAAPEMQTAQATVARPEEKLPTGFYVEGHTSPSPKVGTVNTFTPDAAAKTLVMTIVVNDTSQPGQHLACLHGAVSGEPAGRLRAGLAEGSSSGPTVIPPGDTPASGVAIPLRLSGVPVADVTSTDGQFPTTMTIGSRQEPGSDPLQIADGSIDERFRELLSIEIDETSERWPQGSTKGDRSRFNVVMPDNDKILANLPSLNTTILAKAEDTREVTRQLQLARRPEAGPTATQQSAGVGAVVGVAGAIG